MAPTHSKGRGRQGIFFHILPKRRHGDGLNVTARARENRRELTVSIDINSGRYAHVRKQFERIQPAGPRAGNFFFLRDKGFTRIFSRKVAVDNRGDE